jgi:Holliday junction resolvase-like predicted endonuclease
MRGSAEYVERDVRVLVLAEAWISFCSAELQYVPREIKGEIDLIGYDGETLMVVVVRTAREDQWALSRVSVTAEKQHLVGRQWYACTRMLLTRGGKKAHWKIRRNHRNAVI